MSSDHSENPMTFLLYINDKSNHPPTIHKQITPNVNKCLVSMSSNPRVFDEEKPLYEKALKDGGHPCNLVYSIPSKKKRNRTRKQIYFNPPFSLNVKANIAAAFLRLIDNHFLKGSKLHKYFNHSKIKVSYCTMPNMKKQINKHNARILRDPKDDKDSRWCNCRTGRECPLDG